MTTAQKEKKEKEDRRQKKVKEKQKRMEKEREVPSSAEGKPDLRVRVAGRKGEVPSWCTSCRIANACLCQEVPVVPAHS